jgi:hypothetical protein
LPEDKSLIDHLRAIRGVIVAVFFEELPTAGAREHAFQRRSGRRVRDLPPGGGGTLAAGARVRGTLAEVDNELGSCES